MMEYVYSEEGFQRDLKRLNTLQDTFCEWKKVKARKEHHDALGIKISLEEFYFKKQLGSSYEALKLSRESMKKILYIHFTGNSKLQKITDTIVQRDQKELDKKMKELFPGNESDT